MELLKIRKQKNNRYSLIIMGIFFMLLGILVAIYSYQDNKKKDELNNKLIKDFFEVETKEIDPTDQVVEEKPSSIREENYNYIAILEIPKINLKRGLVSKTSPQNDVDKNIYILKETVMPNEQINSHIILASHSGDTNVSFFKNLNRLDMQDIIYFYYNNIKYTYKVSKKYEIEKTGIANLKQTNTSDITLITCIRGTNKQVVYVATMVNQQKY